MKRIIRFLCICSLAFLTLGIFACQGGDSGIYVGVCPDKIEYGNYFYVPDLYENGQEIRRREYNLSLSIPNGEIIDDFDSEYPMGLIQLKSVGTYTAKYSYNGKEYDLSFTCTEDKTAPVLKKELSVADTYYKGSYFKLVGGTFYDASALNNEVCNSFTFWTCSNGVSLSEMKEDINHETHLFDDTSKYTNVTSDYDNYDGEDKLLIKHNSRYVIVLPAEDIKGNKTEFIYTFNTIEKYYDSSLCDAVDAYGLTFKYKDDNKVLMSFDDEGYTQYAESPYGWGDSTEDIKIQNVDGYKAVVSTPNGRLSPHHLLQIRFFDSITKNDAKYLYFRYRVDQLTGTSSDGRIVYDDYPAMLFGVPYSYTNAALGDFILSDATHVSNSYQFSCVSGNWNVARVPIEYFFNAGETSIEGVKFCISGKFYIDEIWFDSDIFTDSNRQNGILCDFDEEEYIFQIGKETIGDGANLQILDKTSLENRNIDISTVDGSVLLVESISTKYSSACVYIELFEEVEAQSNKKICFSFYYDGRMTGKTFSNLIFQRSDLSSHIDPETYIQIVSKTDGRYCGDWYVVKIDSTIFADENQSFDKIALLVEGALYIDSIWVE